MGMAYYTDPIRKPFAKGLVRCQECDSEYSVKTDWVRAYDVTPRRSTMNPEYITASKILPKEKCISCGSSELIDFNGEKYREAQE